VAHGRGPKFKLQYHKKKEKAREESGNLKAFI
jgi:hypothetical protein